ncbi:hypothetical protein DMUE_1870 [Dictyocoela muelleri]|nr:hypothetical protein DMUE_1870 [Dictyocoela muelleri]
MKKTISKICKECLKCGTEKEYKPTMVMTKFTTPPLEPYEMISIDLKGPIKTRHSSTNNIKEDFYILVVTDLFSRYTEVKFINNIHSSTICKTLEDIWLSKYVIPKKCLKDNGRQFISENFKSLMEKYKIENIYISPHNPTGNSILERINREISVALRMCRGMNIKQTTNNICKRLNLTVNSTLGYCPYEVYFNVPIFNNKKHFLK